MRGHGGDSVQDERDSGGRATSGRGIPKKSWSELGDNEAGLSVTGTNGRELDETSRTILGQDLDRPLERDASESRELHQDGKAENDESVEDRERGQSTISNDDVSIERDINQGDNRRIEDDKDLENLKQGDFVKIFGQVKISIDNNGKEHKNVRILSSKLLKAKEQVKSQDKDKKSILGQIKSFKTDEKSKSNKKDHSKGAER